MGACWAAASTQGWMRPCEAAGFQTATWVKLWLAAEPLASDARSDEFQAAMALRLLELLAEPGRPRLRAAAAGDGKYVAVHP